MNANGRLVTPGLVDCHTHMIFAGHRADELQRRLAGESYAAIAREGRRHPLDGARRRTAERDDALEKRLAEPARALARERLHDRRGEERLRPRAVARELRLLELIRGAAQRVPMRVQRTALLLHALPEEYARPPRGVRRGRCATRTLPEIRGANSPSAVDVFCDPVAFTVEECRTLLDAREGARASTSSSTPSSSTRSGGAQLAAELGARSADHLECASDEDWRALAARRHGGRAAAGRGAHAAARRCPTAEMLRATGARFAIATDFNPGTAPAQSLLECAALAARLCGFTAEETLLAITWNAAKALGVEPRSGTSTPAPGATRWPGSARRWRSCPTGCRRCGRTACSCAARTWRCRRSSAGVAVTRDAASVTGRTPLSKEHRA